MDGLTQAEIRIIFGDAEPDGEVSGADEPQLPDPIRALFEPPILSTPVASVAKAVDDVVCPGESTAALLGRLRRFITKTNPRSPLLAFVGRLEQAERTTR